MKITFIAVGKLKEKFMREAVAEYAKRMGKYAKFEIIEVTDEKTSENMSLAKENRIKEKEGERILKKIGGSGYIIVTEIKGKMLDSVELSKLISDIGLGGENHIYFIIGGSLGVSKEVLERADFLISFSKMTFPHQLMRLILVEQVYRGFRIMGGEPYHK